MLAASDDRLIEVGNRRPRSSEPITAAFIVGASQR
jgi:hypothetical protein